MIRQNLHTHTVFDDGKNTPMEMAQAALDAGLRSLGFSGHSILPYKNDWSMTEATLPRYLSAVTEAKASFAGRLDIFCGLEYDILSQPELAPYDYVIGSIHHIPAGGGYPSVDESGTVTKNTLERFFKGDQIAYAQAYFAQYDAIANNNRIDIVGHFDLLTKFDEPTPLFPADDPCFLDCAVAAMEALVRADKIFEVNTGAISRGYRTVPYPSPTLLRELKARRGRVLITSDAHSIDGIVYAFPQTETLLRDIGFREIWELSEDGFRPRPI